MLTALQLNGAARYHTPHSSANEYIQAVAPCRLPPVAITGQHAGVAVVIPSLGHGERPHPFPHKKEASAMLTPLVLCSAQVPGIGLTRFMLGMVGAYLSPHEL
jgi:hypothetical protein